MLPNHAPLVVAEQFGMLEALHPGRIDLGIGRAPGTDGITAAALRRSADPLSDDDFPQPARRADRLLHGRVPRGPSVRPDHRRAGRGRHARDLAARLVGLLGPARRACSGCRSRSPTTSCPATPTPRSSSTASHFQPSEYLDEPDAMVAVAVDLRRGRRARPLPRRPGAPVDGAAARRTPDPLSDQRGGRGAQVLRPGGAERQPPLRLGDDRRRRDGAREARASSPSAPPPTS